MNNGHINDNDTMLEMLNSIMVCFACVAHSFSSNLISNKLIAQREIFIMKVNTPQRNIHTQS